MSAEQRTVLDQVAAAAGRADFSPLRDQLPALARSIWLPPPLLTGAAALIRVIVDARGDQAPWLVEESIWEQHVPARMPAGRSEWRNAHYALHAAGCLAAGVWLDVARQESFWHLPLWPYALDVLELLTRVALDPPMPLTLDQLKGQLQAQLAPRP
jgi:hypothetical protein